MTKFQFFDFEVFPNWWCVVLGDYHPGISEADKDNFTLITSEDTGYINKLKEMFYREGVVNCGYNIKHYDNIILNAILQGYSPSEVRDISDMTIDPSNYCNPKLKFLTKKKANILFQDMFDDGSHSLKENEGNLGLDIRESEVSFNKVNLTKEDIEDIVSYCRHDVYATMILYKEAKFAYVKAKETIAKAFNLPLKDVYANTNAGLVSKVLQANYRTYTDGDDIIKIPSKIEGYVLDNVPIHILNNLITNTKMGKVKLFDNVVSYGIGGLHSVYADSLYVESTKDYALINIDVASFYPSIMIQLELLSRSVTNPMYFTDLFNTRIALKHKVDATEEDDLKQKAYKLVINTTFGASGCRWLPIYDPYSCKAVCVIGQLLLTAFAMKIHKNLKTLKIIQGNTDGILVYLHRDEVEKLTNYVKEWENVTTMMFEMEEWTKIWQRDVNNYIAIDNRGKTKTRGAWVTAINVDPNYGVTKSLAGHISRESIVKYLTEGKSIVENILQCNELKKFCYSANKGSGYSGIEHRHPDGTVDKLHKCNRVIATKDKSYGTLVKTGTYKGKPRSAKVGGIPMHCMLVNKDLSTYNFNEIKKTLDYEWYLEQAYNGLPDESWLMIKNDIIKSYDINI